MIQGDCAAFKQFAASRAGPHGAPYRPIQDLKLWVTLSVTSTRWFETNPNGAVGLNAQDKGEKNP